MSVFIECWLVLVCCIDECLNLYSSILVAWFVLVGYVVVLNVNMGINI